jgi:tetratricopeptide (TPR) repeat protein
MQVMCRLALCAAALAVGSCVHTPAGTSVEIALAKKASLVRLPTAPEVAQTPGATAMPPVEPELPMIDDRIEAVADAYTRGKFAMADGKDTDAITAFEETVRIDPSHHEAWQNLALLYEKTGASKKAVAAFRKAKNVETQ